MRKQQWVSSISQGSPMAVNAFTASSRVECTSAMNIHNLTEDNSPDDVLFFNATTKDITYGDKSTISSDRRLKYDIENLENSLLITRQLYPKKYLKKNRIEDPDGNGKFQIGLIAQDILDISNIRGLNKLVAGGNYYDAKLGARVEHPYAIKYNDVHVITLGAVKELDRIVQQQQAQINMLTNRLILVGFGPISVCKHIYLCLLLLNYPVQFFYCS